MGIFNTVTIETSALCNRTCVFCPNTSTKRPDDLMLQGTFDRLIAELSEMYYRGRIELYMYNEPTRDTRLPDLIQQVRRQVPRSCIMISTNGDYIHSADDVKAWFDHGLNQLLINIYSANDGGTGDSSAAQTRYEQMTEWVESLGLLSKPIYSHTKSRVCKVEAKFGVQKDGTGFTDGVFKLTNRSGNIDFVEKTKEPLERMCVRPFRVLNINWKGQGLLCCNDYHATMPMEGTLEEIWNCEIMRQYRFKLQNKDRNAHLCDVCDVSAGAYPANIELATGDINTIGEYYDPRNSN